MMAAKSLELTQTSVFSLQTRLHVHNEWRVYRCDGKIGKHETKLRVEVEMEWVASVPAAPVYWSRLTYSRLELFD